MSKDSSDTTTEKQSPKDLMNQLKKRLANALSPEDIRTLMNEIRNSPLLPGDKQHLITTAAAILEKVEAEITAKTGGVNAPHTKEELKTAKEEQQRHDLKVQPIYNDFDKIHTSFLTKQEAHNQNLDKALEDLKNNKTISNETIAALTKTPEEIEQEKKNWAKIHLASKTAHAEKEYHTNKIVEIDQVLKSNSSKSTDLSSKPKLSDPELIEARKTHMDLLAKADTKIEETNKHYKQRDKEKAKLESALKESKTPGVDPVNAEFIQKKLDMFHAMHNTPIHLQEQTKVKQLEVSSREGLSKSNDKNSIRHPSAKTVAVAKDIREKIQQNLTCTNQPKDKNGQPQTTIPVAPRNKVIKDRNI